MHPVQEPLRPARAPRRKPAWIRVLASIGLTLAGAPCPGAIPGPAPADPGVALVAPRRLELGRVKPGIMLRFEIGLTNAGATPLELGTIHASCSCVVPGKGPARIAPGEAARLPIEFYTGGFTGPIRETLVIDAPGSATPLATIELAARVWLPVEASPSFLVLERPPSNAPPAASYTRSIRLTNQLATPVRLGPPRGESKAFAAELKVIQPGQVFELQVRPVPPLGTGHLYGRFLLPTSHPDLPELEVTAYLPAAGLPPPKPAPAKP